jgi:tripartite-type tricarboxylate transporter receptor subunit TctC
MKWGMTSKSGPGRRALVRALALAAAVAAFGPLSGRPAAADTYPSRPIRAIVPFAAGSATDIVARAFGDRMGAILGQTIVIENRPGANGMIGADAVAKAQPDGYTILIGTNSTNAAAPALFNNVPFDMHKDFQPVSFLCSVPLIVAVSNEVPAKTLGELIALAKTRNDLTFASASASQRVSTEMLLAMTGIKMTHVPYRQGPTAMQDLIAGRVTLFTADLGVMLPQVRSNTVRALAVTSSQRSPQMPDLPTVDEAAGVKGYELIAWFAMFTPANVPAEIVAKLNGAVREAAKSPELQNALVTSLGMQVAPSSPGELSARVREEAAKWLQAATVAGIEKQ